MQPMIEAKGIVNHFGKQVVHDGLNLTFMKGEILGLVGGSGSGKSVLLRTLLGLHRPDAGSVRVKGQDVLHMNEDEKREMGKKWGVLFQEGALFSGLSVQENVEFPLREYTDKLPEQDIESLALFKLGMVGLKGDAAEKFPSELSGGMTRRAGLARALAFDPEMLFLDEPTAGLDPVAASALDELLLKLRDILDLSIFIITHDLDTLTTVCDRVAMLVDKKITVGTVQELMKSSHPDIHNFFCGPRMRAAIGK